MKTIEYKLLGETWTINLLSSDDFFDKYDPEDRACTLTDSRIIDFCDDHLQICYIIHEVTHAYLTYQITFFDKDEEVMEEHMCYFNQKYLYQICEDSKNILTLLGGDVNSDKSVYRST